MGFLARVVLNLLRSLFLFKRATEKTPIHAPKPVGATKQHSSELTALRFVRKPLAAENGYEADPSHSEITGLPQGDSPQAALIGDLIAECIQAIHPAIIDD